MVDGEKGVLLDKAHASTHLLYFLNACGAEYHHILHTRQTQEESLKTFQKELIQDLLFRSSLILVR